MYKTTTIHYSLLKKKELFCQLVNMKCRLYGALHLPQSVYVPGKKQIAHFDQINNTYIHFDWEVQVYFKKKNSSKCHIVKNTTQNCIVN